ncbi:type II CAAX prenyl endopeptidase Rce1 family protein [Telluribacter sp. SYSU D00476]|uniref:CPBP family glutamic-type intramembrane protease n=1 Tax=Telluribacter sp. SYSU D00476 TaxID=2811430 RepID=UPI001FF4738D|nr:CPBP family glutamic-type intramembrane protease [Telluribacter sp. SYSU D00476]
MRPGFIVKDFLHFLRNPTYSLADVPVRLRVVLGLFVALTIFRAAAIVADVWLIRPIAKLLSHQDLARQTVYSTSLLELVVGSLVMAPLVEELAYRWGLHYSPARIALSLGLIVFYWLPFGGTYSTNIIQVLNQPGFYLMVVMAAVAGLTAFALLSVPLLEASFRRRWQQQFGLIFYLSSLLFGLMHIFNVAELTWSVWLLAPFITVQQIVFGLFNGYVRMRFGFMHAVVQHALFNLIPLLLLYV